MKRPMILMTAAAAVTLAACGASYAQNGATPRANSSADLKAFPEATAGQTRHVILLPERQNEDAMKVEIIVGKTARVDCNNHFFGGQIETRTAQGWGYDYYVLPSLGTMAGTLMGCPANSEREKFVAAPNQPLVRYNSRLPLVVYAPQDVEVRYRLWSAGETLNAH